jgi:4'-phosphopantetheinyl transferase
MFRNTSFNSEPSEYPGMVEFIPLPNGQEQFGGKVYQVKGSGTSGILGEIWDINPQRSHFSVDNEKILSDEEISRADRIIPANARNNFIARRVVLRTILSRYLNIPPEKICFTYNPWGRPSIEEEGEPGRIFFNLSHTEGRILIAVSQQFQPGVDCEAISSSTEVMGIARSYFHPDVGDYLETLGSSERTYQFFRIWVHTEACMKAIGKGLVQFPRVPFFPPSLPIPAQYMITLPDHPYNGVLIAMDLPSSGCNSVAACAFRLPSGHS